MYATLVSAYNFTRQILRMDDKHVLSLTKKREQNFVSVEIAHEIFQLLQKIDGNRKI